MKAAKLHVGRPFLLHLDIQNCFPSVSGAQVKEAFEESGASEELSRDLTALVVAEGQLPQGAPSSVAISNIVLRRLDRRVGGLCKKFGLTYSRYVDDIAISGGRRLEWLEERVRRIVEDENFRLNDKGGLIPADRQHKYLGIVLNTTPNVDASYIYDLRSTIWALNRAPDLPSMRTSRKLLGRLHYVRAVNRRLGERLLKEFGPYLTTATGPGDSR